LTTYPTYIPTGKENAIYSVAKYLKEFFGHITPISGRTVAVVDLGYEQFQDYPSILISDQGAPQLGDISIGRVLGDGKQGRWEQTQIEINCLDCNTDLSPTVMTAEQNVRRLRDLVKYALQMSGMTTSAGDQILPPIRLLDHSALVPDTYTGSVVWTEREKDSTWIETFVKDVPEKPNEKRYRIYCRLLWKWYE
jgi:hypothetical protein